MGKTHSLSHRETATTDVDLNWFTGILLLPFQLIPAFPVSHLKPLAEPAETAILLNFRVGKYFPREKHNKQSYQQIEK